ncbi:hypothetical protein RJ639_003297 [Escallonia herrerae]|uniref:Bromo domain-containing protein n=1 Tax=Escallonia herrerae TaxID=1293975 RepID=A0AA88W1T6_9ASTE|nr:hypothetical protein RJ639_003297 [Escallonia herrerae]
MGSESKSSISEKGSNKRKEILTVDSRTKRRKLDISVKLQCSTIIGRLMCHLVGWVDPVRLNIPDYFSIIAKPMDLGTVKANLENDMYMTAEDFAADVRLKFSNAMLYNWPSNDVHLMASKLSDIFNARWKSLGGEISKAKKGTEIPLGHCLAPNAELGVKLTSGLRKSDSDGALSSLDEENIGSSLGSSTASAFTEETCAWLHGIQVSPEKASRVAMLKSRFADTISEAEEKTNKLADPMLQEKERLHTEKEAHIKAAVASKRRRLEAEMKIQRQREREAARIELEKIKKTVEQELEKLTSKLDRITDDLGKNHFRSNLVLSRTQYSKSQLITIIPSVVLGSENSSTTDSPWPSDLKIVIIFTNQRL